MRLVYVLLSPTFGMHQYTADLANRAVAAGHEVHLVTTSRLPRDRYVEEVQIHTPVDTRDSGFSSEALHFSALRLVQPVIEMLGPDVIHFTGPHLWNIWLLLALRRVGIPTVHTLHDLDPHHGSPYGRLLYFWNSLVVRYTSHILVHCQMYRDRLLEGGRRPGQVTCTPLLHLFLGADHFRANLDPACDDGSDVNRNENISYEPWALFFGRLEPYKGVDYLLTVCDMLNGIGAASSRVIVAGAGKLDGLWAGPLPARLELRNRTVGDEEALDLFRRCGLLVLPYVDASQSALIAAAYYFRKPVLVTRTGALPEYVEDGRTGCIVERCHAAGLARALERMLADRAGLLRMGTAGRLWYETRRPQETAALFSMYRKVACERRGGRA